MRRLAAVLGVSPMAAYRHVSSKEELLRIAAGAVVADIAAPPVGAPWQQVLQTFFETVHDRLLKHPGVAPLFGGQAFLSETVYAVADPVFASLIHAGFDPQTAVAVFMACATCSIGSALLEAEAAHQADTRNDDRVVLLSAGKYPGIAAVASYLPRRQSPQSNTEALRILIAGYAGALHPTAST